MARRIFRAIFPILPVPVNDQRIADFMYAYAHKVEHEMFFASECREEYFCMVEEKEGQYGFDKTMRVQR